MVSDRACIFHVKAICQGHIFKKNDIYRGLNFSQTFDNETRV